ncbi:MAG TPA: 16S rRNA (guanine(966)-N(2))-methyltransferase RsmD [Candidatus Limnocylindria bacterium]|nr:16S rRNA (guanine(966)-N(2))-methyltransferase RsmD [Candidatus Limnocylindria bacterium]
MRVIAGSARGIQLVVPKRGATRPITDRVKETLFAILGERVPGARVLDLYAGSGAIGIEALSRGATHCTFVEQARDALGALRTNLERSRMVERATVRAGDVLRMLDGEPAHRYDLVILDPPYAERAILAPLERLLPRLAEDATVVVKHFWRTEVETPPGLAPWRTRRFGETALTFLRTDGGARP